MPSEEEYNQYFKKLAEEINKNVFQYSFLIPDQGVPADEPIQKGLQSAKALLREDIGNKIIVLNVDSDDIGQAILSKLD